VCEVGSASSVALVAKTIAPSIAVSNNKETRKNKKEFAL